jgi:hypothetical protein
VAREGFAERFVPNYHRHLKSESSGWLPVFKVPSSGEGPFVYAASMG